MGDKWEVGLQSSSPLNTGTHTAGVPSPRATMVKVAPMPSPVTASPTQAKSTGMRMHCQLAPRTNPAANQARGRCLALSQAVLTA